MLKYLLDYILEHRFQLAKFIIGGLFSAGVYFFCFYLFYTAIGLDYRIATLIAYVITIGCHFLLHRIFTFNAETQSLAMSSLKYLALLGVNYLITLGMVYIFVSILKQSPYIGLFFSAGVTSFISFFAMKYFVFTLHNKNID